ncbi:MAG: hypothetical protein ABIP71_11615 [Verrucomicrobiota bacterium]
MSLNANRSRLAALTKALSNDWKQTKESWRDAKAQEFEQRYLEELFDGVDTAVAVMDQLDKLLNKIKTDCE